MELTALDLARLDALLHAPDPPDLPPRRRLLTCLGDPSRRSTVMLPLLTRWLQGRYVMVECNEYTRKM